MPTFEVGIIINQPIEIITEALMNPDKFPYWTTDLEKFEVIKGKPGEVGAIGHLHYTQKGRSYIMEDKLIYSEPGKKYVSEVSGDILTAIVETNLHSSGNETKMTVKWTGKANNFIFKLLLPIIRGKMIKQSKAELETFKRLVETKGSKFD